MVNFQHHACLLSSPTQNCLTFLLIDVSPSAFDFWLCIAVALHQEQEPRSEILAKMVERAKQLESRSAQTLQAVADTENGHPTNG